MERNRMNADATDAEQSKTAETAETAPRSAGGCGCGCGGLGKGSNKLVIAIWVVFLLGFACVLMYTRSNGRAESEKLLNDAYALYEKQDFAGAADLLRRSAELGNPWAQIYYGGCLKNGSGVAADPAAAVEWYRKAAAQDNSVAYYELAVCYEYGQGVAPSPDEAFAWYKKALDSGIGEAQMALWRVAVAKANDLFAHQRYREAVELLKPAAEEGCAEAQACFAACLMNASGVNPDPFAAVEWYRKAAAQNNPTAIYSLGVCYENGEGVDRNLDTALEWYRKALAAGLEDAQSAIIRVEKLQAQNEAGSD